MIGTAEAQPLTYGVKAGLRATDQPADYGSTESRRYLVGPAISVRLPYRFSLEVDALYQRLGWSTSIPLIMYETWIRVRGNAWEFPLLATYHLPGGRLHPFVSTGYAPRLTSGRTDTTGYTPVTISLERAYAYHTGWHAHDRAWVAGGGIEWQAGHLRVSPEVRYLRWTVPRSPYPDQLADHVPVGENEVQVLVGIGWSRKAGR